MVFIFNQLFFEIVKKHLQNGVPLSIIYIIIFDIKEKQVMTSVKITLCMAEHVKQFVNIVNKYPYDIDLRSGRFVIDAKSILGIFSLDLSRPIVCEIHSDKCEALLSELQPYTAD